MGEVKPEPGSDESKMSGIPPKLRDFLDLGRQLILIRGEPGTGKTTFGLELIYEGLANSVYVSTRVNKEDLCRQVPWACDIIPEKNIIDATSMNVPARASELVEAPDAYFRLPEPIKRAYEVATKSKGPTAIVFDSWDALVDRFERAEKLSGKRWTRREVEGLLVDAFASQEANIILITERATMDGLDYVVDGVIILTMTLEDGRILREIWLRKLRGMEIGRPRHLFTLHGGKFRIIQPFQHELAGRPIGPMPIPNAVPGRVSSGIPDLDRLSGGGYLKGSINVFEVGEWAGYSYINLVLPAAINFMMGEKGFYIVAGGNVDIRAAEDICIRSLGAEKCHEHMANLFMGKKVPPGHPYLIQAKMESIDEDIELVEQYVEEKTGAPAAFAVLAYDTLEHVYGIDELKRFMATHSNEVRRTGRVEFWMVRDWQREIINHVRVMASTRWRMISVDGAVLLRGQRPDTAFHAIEISVEDGYQRLHLTPIS